MGCLFKTHQSEQQVIAGNLPSLLWRAGISATGLSGGGFLNVNSLFCQTSTRKRVLRGPQNPPCRAPHRLTNPKRYFLYHTSTIFSEQPGQTYFQAETGLFLGHPHPVALHSYQGCPKGLFLHRLAWLAALLQNVMDTGGCEALALPAALLSRSGGGLFLPGSFLSPFPASNIHALFHKTLPWQSAKRNKSDTEPNPEQSAAWPCRAYPSTPPEGKHRCSSPGGPRARGRRERKH